MKSRGKNHCCVSKNARKHGTFRRKSDSQVIQRFRCRVCKETFSTATHQPNRGQNKRHINFRLGILLSSGVSMRRAAWILRVNHKTIARKLLFLGKEDKKKNQKMNLKGYFRVQFDELQTIEHTKLKPLSIAMAVSKDGRKILGFRVAKMPATGHLAKKSRKKYGVRPDERIKKLRSLFKELRQKVSPTIQLASDECPFYKGVVSDYFPRATYTQFKGKKGCVTGQGELKKTGFDWLFSVNHTFAMMRSDVNRLIRKTWCTTKKIDGLVAHLNIYMDAFNHQLTPSFQKKRWGFAR